MGLATQKYLLFAQLRRAVKIETDSADSESLSSVTDQVVDTGTSDTSVDKKTIEDGSTKELSFKENLSIQLKNKAIECLIHLQNVRKENLLREAESHFDLLVYEVFF